jgi:MATE family multidrug resistance protein
MGVIGAAWSLVTTTFTTLLVLCLTIKCGGYLKGALHWPTHEDVCGTKFSDIIQIIRLGLPSYLMFFLELSSFEVLALASGLIGINELATNTALLNIFYICYMFPTGIQQGGASMIGNCLGEGKIRLAKEIGKAMVIVAIAIVII